MEQFSVINKVILAPMVRIGTLPFRRLSLNHGADIVFSEEIIDKKLMNCQKIFNTELNTNDYIYKDGSLALRIHEKEKKNLIVQIGTSNPKTALDAALLVKDDVIGIDVNMGCPKHFSTHGNMGSSLLALPDLVKEILENLVKNIDKPISCKIRLLENMEKTLHFVDVIQNTGIKFFTIHLRKKDQTPKVMADWKSLFKIKQHAKIPVIANGDIFCKNDMLKIKHLTNCDGYMIARGAIHNPNIFNEYKEFIINSENFKVFDNTVIDNDNYEIEDNKEQNEIENKSNKSGKTRKNEADNDLQVSNKLCKILEGKYGDQKINIMEMIKEYLEIAIKTGNSYGNTKYNVLYILKTHKAYIDLFSKIQKLYTYPELCNEFGLKDFYLNYIKENEYILKYIDGSYYKSMFEKDKKKTTEGESLEFLKDEKKKKKKIEEN